MSWLHVNIVLHVWSTSYWVCVLLLVFVVVVHGIFFCKQCMSACAHSLSYVHHSNRAFAREYTKLVPDTFSIINDQDVVVHNAKFLGYYKVCVCLVGFVFLCVVVLLCGCAFVCNQCSAVYHINENHPSCVPSQRPAWRVILNTKGDMIVRPSFMEITLHEIIGGRDISM